MLATPWPMSSTLGLWWSLLMRSETTADMRDSIAPSMATVRAGPSRPWIRSARNRGITKWGKPGGDSAETRADGFHRQLEQDDGCGAEQESDDCAGDAIGEGAAENHHQHRACGQRGRGVGKRVEAAGQSFHALPEDAGNFGELQAEEILYLRAGDQDGDAVGEADDDGARNELDRRAHAGDAHDHQQNAGHHGAHEEAIDAVKRDDAGDDHDEGAGGSANLRFGAAQRRRSESR